MSKLTNLILNKRELDRIYDGVSKGKNVLEEELEKRKDLAPSVRDICQQSIEFDKKLLIYVKAKMDEVDDT